MQIFLDCILEWLVGVWVKSSFALEPLEWLEWEWDPSQRGKRKRANNGIDWVRQRRIGQRPFGRNIVIIWPVGNSLPVYAVKERCPNGEYVHTPIENWTPGEAAIIPDPRLCSDCKDIAEPATSLRPLPLDLSNTRRVAATLEENLNPVESDDEILILDVRPAPTRPPLSVMQALVTQPRPKPTFELASTMPVVIGT